MANGGRKLLGVGVGLALAYALFAKKSPGKPHPSHAPAAPHPAPHAPPKPRPPANIPPPANEPGDLPNLGTIPMPGGLYGDGGEPKPEPGPEPGIPAGQGQVVEPDPDTGSNVDWTTYNMDDDEERPKAVSFALGTKANDAARMDLGQALMAMGYCDDARNVYALVVKHLRDAGDWTSANAIESDVAHRYADCQAENAEAKAEGKTVP